MKAARKAITQTLLTLAKNDPSIFALATDSSGSVTLTDFAKTLPQQFVECGIAEQDAIGIAAGLASTGLRPFACGPACFYATRAAEQIKVDVAYSRMNVKILGVSGGVSYGALGATHHAVQDIAFFRAVPGFQVILPSDANSAAALTRELAVSNVPAYIRVGRGEVEDIYSEDVNVEIGKALIVYEGTDLAIIACGEMVYSAKKAAEELHTEGVSALVVDMHTIKPLDYAAIDRAITTGKIITVEEHSIFGGLGSAVAEYVCQKQPIPMRLMGLPDEALFSGASKEVFAHYGLTPEGIVKTARELL